ncbi:hypothetical protein BDP27DRAFT_918022 [Rhodocollybia butyracea]|uniref:Uncharacterized protein n=1 Tax=Rhodocollybia butyracea TaxID=206335 RepID=A0A9P5PSP7_9AGAR|nr:hypothetical protein BDP27DRAFT_918022 [Rhodocollybia butyracea]
MFLVENPSLHLVTASQGEAKVREEICHESYLLIRRYLIDAGEKGKDIPKFSEMMQASSGITWRTFKDLDSYDLYRVSFTNLITTYLRWKTTDLQRKLPLNVPPEIEKAFLPLLRMIHRRRCGNVDELAPIIHNIFVKVILWEQSTEIKTPLLLEKVVALQSVELGGFRPIKRVSGLCSMIAALDCIFCPVKCHIWGLGRTVLSSWERKSWVMWKIFLRRDMDFSGMGSQIVVMKNM